MGFELFKATLRGTAPLLMHNGHLADPTNSMTRAIKVVAGRRRKTDEDYEELKRLEWLGSLYEDPASGQISLPGAMVVAAVRDGARKSKNGRQALAAVFSTREFFPLAFEGPQSPKALYAAGANCDYRSVRVQSSRTMRCRPRFDLWALPVELQVNVDVLDVRTLVQALEVAGEVVGLGDYRPQYGRFRVEC